MPSIYSLFDEQPSKSKWKKLLNQSVHSHVEALWKSEVESKNSLKYVNPDSLKVGKSHPVWSSVRCNMMDNKRAQVKCKLITGTYILQGNRATFNQHDVNPTCKLCHTAPETRQHFLSECTSFLTERQEFITKIQTNPVLNEKMNDFLNTPENLTQLLLDASALLNTSSVQTDVLDLLELYTREYIYKIHKKRVTKLKQISHN